MKYLKETKMSNVFGSRIRPTRNELLRQKKRLELAERAHKLLEDKYRILNMEKENTIEALHPFQQMMEEKTKEAYSKLLDSVKQSSLTKLALAEGLTKVNDEIAINWVNLYGISIPKIQSNPKRRKIHDRGYDVYTTDPWIDDAAAAFEELLNLILAVAEMKNIANILTEEASKTHIRVVALEEFLIPRLRKDVKRIDLKLQEREQEGVVIQKWVRGKKPQEH